MKLTRNVVAFAAGARILAFGASAAGQSPPPQHAAHSPAPAHSEASAAVGSAASGSSKDLQDAQNPIANRISIPLQYNFNGGVGPDSRAQHVLNLQPVVPISIGKWALINRAILPVMSQPTLRDDRVGGLGDLTLQAYVVPPTGKHVSVGLGPVALLPTATDDALGTGKFGLGPAGVFVFTNQAVTVGLLVTNVFSFAGSSRREDVNQGTLQPFVNVNLPKRFFIVSSPVMTANWRASASDVFTVPVGGGLGYLAMLDKIPVSFSLQGFYNVARPEAGPDYTVRGAMSVLLPGL